MTEMAEAGNTNFKRQNSRRVRFRKSESRSGDELTTAAVESEDDQSTPCQSVVHLHVGSGSNSCRRTSLPSILRSSPHDQDGSILPCYPVRLPGMVSSSSSVQPMTPNFNTTLQSMASVVRTRQLSSRDQGLVPPRPTRARRASSASRRRTESHRRYTVTTSEQIVASSLPRYSQLSGHLNDEDNSGNSLDGLHSVQSGLPPRYSTGTIPEESQNRDDVFRDLHFDGTSLGDEGSTGIQATSILFLFVCTVHLVMGIILSVIAARANSSTPAEISTSAYTWPGILSIALGLEGIVAYGCLKNSSLVTRFLLGGCIILGLTCLSINLQFALAARSDAERYESDYKECVWDVQRKSCHCYSSLPDLTKLNGLSESSCSPKDTDAYSSVLSLFICNITAAVPDVITFLLAIMLMKRSMQQRRERVQSHGTNISLTSVLFSAPSRPHSANNATIEGNLSANNRTIENNHSANNRTIENNHSASNVNHIRPNLFQPESTSLPPPYRTRGLSLPNVGSSTQSVPRLPSYHTALTHPTVNNTLSQPHTDDDVFI